MLHDSSYYNSINSCNIRQVRQILRDKDWEGYEVVSAPIEFFSNDTAAGISKRWNPVDTILMRLPSVAGMPTEGTVLPLAILTRDELDIEVTLEKCVVIILQQIKQLQNGFLVWGSSKKKEVVVMGDVLNIVADPIAATKQSTYKVNYFCRLCLCGEETVIGTKKSFNTWRLSGATGLFEGKIFSW